MAVLEAVVLAEGLVEREAGARQQHVGTRVCEGAEGERQRLAGAVRHQHVARAQRATAGRQAGGVVGGDGGAALEEARRMRVAVKQAALRRGGQRVGRGGRRAQPVRSRVTWRRGRAQAAGRVSGGAARRGGARGSQRDATRERAEAVACGETRKAAESVRARGVWARADREGDEGLVRHGRHVTHGVHHLEQKRRAGRSGGVSGARARVARDRTGWRRLFAWARARGRAFLIGFVLRSAASEPRALSASGARLRRGRASAPGGTGGGSAAADVAGALLTPSSGSGAASLSLLRAEALSASRSATLPPSSARGEGVLLRSAAPRPQEGPSSSSDARGGRPLPTTPPLRPSLPPPLPPLAPPPPRHGSASARQKEDMELLRFSGSIAAARRGQRSARRLEASSHELARAFLVRPLFFFSHPSARRDAPSSAHAARHTQHDGRVLCVLRRAAHARAGHPARRRPLLPAAGRRARAARPLGADAALPGGAARHAAHNAQGHPCVRALRRFGCALRCALRVALRVSRARATERRQPQWRRGRFFRADAASARRRARSVSAHWEEEVATVMTSPAPPMLYDYYGFPPEAYKLQWPAPGAPQLARRVRELLSAAGIPSREGARVHAVRAVRACCACCACVLCACVCCVAASASHKTTGRR